LELWLSHGQIECLSVQLLGAKMCSFFIDLKKKKKFWFVKENYCKLKLQLHFIILPQVFFVWMNVIFNSIFGNMLYGGIKPRTKKTQPTQKKSFVGNIECKDKSYVPKQGGCMQIPKNHRSWRQKAIKLFASQNSNSQLLLPTWTSHPKYLNNPHSSKFPKNLKKTRRDMKDTRKKTTWKLAAMPWSSFQPSNFNLLHIIKF
jgi:hypothetical protein